MLRQNCDKISRLLRSSNATTWKKVKADWTISLLTSPIFRFNSAKRGLIPNNLKLLQLKHETDCFQSTSGLFAISRPCHCVAAAFKGKNGFELTELSIVANLRAVIFSSKSKLKLYAWFTCESMPQHYEPARVSTEMPYMVSRSARNHLCVKNNYKPSVCVDGKELNCTLLIACILIVIKVID